MLHRIVVINSELYAKANLLIGDAESIQLAAENNVGKSSLINALNFLYILNKNEWKFGANTSSETIKHYFRTVEQSYVVFEIVKDGHYCIVVKRAPDKEELVYSIISHAYEDDMFFRRDGEKMEPLKFTEIIGNLTKRNIDLKVNIKPEELYQRVYSTNRRDKPVVLITDKVKRPTNRRSNSFTRMYGYLINANAIDEKAFKESLLIADNKLDVDLDVFTDRKQDVLQEFESKREKIRRLEAVTADFKNFKLLNDHYNTLKDHCGALKFNFLENYKIAYYNLRQETQEDGLLAIQIRTLQTQIEDTLNREKDKLIGDRTRLEVKQEEQWKEKNSLEKGLSETYPYRKGTLEYEGLVQEIDKLKIEIDQLAALLSQLAKPTTTEVTIRQKIKSLVQECQDLNTKIDQFDHLAVHHLSKNPEIRRQLATYLHTKVLSLDKRNIQREVTQLESVLGIFDGAIDVSILPAVEIETLEHLKERLPQAEVELATQKELLAALTQQQEKEHRKNEAERLLRDKQAFFEKVMQRPSQERILSETQEMIEELASKITIKNDEIFKKENEIKSKRAEKERLEKDLNEKRILLRNFTEWYKEVQDRTDVSKIESPVDPRNPKELIGEFREVVRQIGETREQRNNHFNSLLRKLNKDSNDINEFVKEVQEELDTLPEIRKNVEGLFETTVHTFVNPVKSFLLQYANFRSYVQKFSQRLSEFPVSNIRKISIHTKDNNDLLRELEMIHQVDFSSLWRDSTSNEEGIRMIRQKFEENRAIQFDKLFDLELEIEMDNDKRKTVSLAKQIESQGTDAVLKLFLFLSVIRQLADDRANNKIAIYFDELGRIGPKNISQVVHFCKTNHFIPIFAAPTEIEGIEKYYLIKPSLRHKQGIVLDDRHVKTARYRDANRSI